MSVQSENLIVKRQKFISLALKYAKSGSGSHSDFLKNRTLTYSAPNLKKIFINTPFVIVGGLATRLYMPERMTLDADVLIVKKEALKAENELQKAGCQKHGILSIGGSTWILPDSSLSIYVIMLDEPWTEEAVHHPVIASDNLPYIDLP